MGLVGMLISPTMQLIMLMVRLDQSQLMAVRLLSDARARVADKIGDLFQTHTVERQKGHEAVPKLQNRPRCRIPTRRLG